jgi:hypothetical protein
MGEGGRVGMEGEGIPDSGGMTRAWRAWKSPPFCSPASPAPAHWQEPHVYV